MIYLDVLLLVNFLLSYFLLLAAGALSGQRARFGRMLAGSGVSALTALILFCPELPYPLQVAYKLATAALITAVCFGWHGWRRFLAAVCWFAALNIGLAGLALLVILRTGTPLVHTGNMAVYLRVSPLLLMGLAGVCCLAVELLLRLRGAPAKSRTAGLEVTLCGRPVRLRAALDTGCHLKDPMTCLPVLLISYKDARARLPEELCGFLDDWFAGARQVQPPGDARLRLIPCTTAAEQTLLPGFAVEDIGLITENGVLGLGRTAVAFAPRSFGSEAYEALYGSDFL